MNITTLRRFQQEAVDNMNTILSINSTAGIKNQEF